MRVLVVEDNEDTADYIIRGLTQEGQSVDWARTGREGFLRALDDDFDVVVVDRMIPELDGLAMVRAIREAGNTTPVLFLSAMDGVSDRVDGLTAGGDDYLTKPFAFAELSARLQALTRRPTLKKEETELRVADLVVDLLRQKVSRAGRPIELQPREFRLLCYFMRHTERVVTRTMLLEAVWEFHFNPQTNVVDALVSRLRNKVDKPFDAALIHTVRGSGYSLHA